jgi:hypothetical protein
VILLNLSSVDWSLCKQQLYIPYNIFIGHYNTYTDTKAAIGLGATSNWVPNDGLLQNNILENGTFSLLSKILTIKLVPLFNLDNPTKSARYNTVAMYYIFSIYRQINTTIENYDFINLENQAGTNIAAFGTYNSEFYWINSIVSNITFEAYLYNIWLFKKVYFENIYLSDMSSIDSSVFQTEYNL